MSPNTDPNAVISPVTSLTQMPQLSIVCVLLNAADDTPNSVCTQVCVPELLGWWPSPKISPKTKEPPLPRLGRSKRVCRRDLCPLLSCTLKSDGSSAEILGITREAGSWPRAPPKPPQRSCTPSRVWMFFWAGDMKGPCGLEPCAAPQEWLATTPRKKLPC